MKISNGNGIRGYDNMLYKLKNQNTETETKSVNNDRDQIIIGSGLFKIEEKKIVEEAVRNVSVEVRTPTSEEKIESLKQQIKEGSYHPNPDEIVSRMLLERGNRR